MGVYGVQAIIAALQRRRRELKNNSSQGALPTTFWKFIEKVRPTYYKGYQKGYKFLSFPLSLLLQGEQNLIFCKGSQVGATEVFLSYILFQLYQKKRNIFYMLPTADEVSDFSAARFNPVIEECGELEKAFKYDNVHHKRCGSVNLYLRGGNSKSKIKSVPVSLLIIDEVDEISAEVVEIVEERLSGSLEKQIITLSTPTLPDVGVWKKYKNSSQYSYMLTCPFCSVSQTLSFEDSLNMEKEILKCRRCKRGWSHLEKIEMVSKGEWQLQKKGNGIGFHISQLYSPTVTAQEICRKYKEIEGETQKQVFLNHKLGLPYISAGSKLSGELVDSRLGNEYSNKERYVGIDISQSNLHYVVLISVHSAGIVIEKVCRSTWEDLPKYMQKWEVYGIVVDANPERYSARQFQEAVSCSCFLALYPNIKTLIQIDEKKGIVSINRTEIIDLVFNRFREDHILIQEKIMRSGEYENLKKHLCSTTRQYREKKEGVFEAFYQEVGDDHYLHALCYAEIASRIQSVGEERIVGSFL